MFAPLQWQVTALRLSGRGSWQAELDNGATLQLGRGSEDEVAARTGRFVASVGQVTGQYRRELQYADLRHADGYAVRLRGVTTTSAASAPKKSR
jgi:cell division protein FtsQ